MRGWGSGMNFDTQGADRPYDFDYYWPDHIEDPPMTYSVAIHMGSLAESIEPNSCQELYGIGAFKRKGSMRQGKLFQNKPLIPIYIHESMPDDELVLALDWMREHEVKEPSCD